MVHLCILYLWYLDDEISMGTPRTELGIKAFPPMGISSVSNPFHARHEFGKPKIKKNQEKFIQKSTLILLGK